MPSKPMIMVLGPSGSGKSTSYEHLPRETTAVIDLELKGFPFKDPSFYSVIECRKAEEVTSAVEKALKDDNVKLVVIDSLTKFTEYVLAECRVAFKGYDIWSQYAIRIRNFLNKIRNDKKPVIVISIDEIVKIEQPDGGIVSRLRAAVQGKELEGKLEKEFLIVLCTEVVVDSKTGTPSYLFRTFSTVSTAKAPRWLDLPATMPNDLKPIVDKLL